MRVLQILYSGLGGHGSVVFSLVAADKEKAWKHALLFYGVEDLKPEYEMLCRHYSIPYLFVKKARGIDITSLKRIFHFIKEQSPHAILLHSATLAPYMFFGGFKLCNKVFLVEHTPNRHKTKSEWFSSLSGMLFLKKVVCLTRPYSNEMKKRLKFFYRPRKVAVVPNGIDTNFFSPAQASQKEEKLISMVARFTATKDQLTLIHAFRLLVAKMPDARLVLAGDGETKEENERLVKTLNLQNNVVFTGTIYEPQVRDLLCKTTLYVHSSLSETMSTSMMQAMSCGLPVIASDIPGINNFLNGENGILFAPGNANELAEKIFMLLTDTAKAEALSTAARNYSLTHFSNDTMFKRYNELITKLK